MPLSKTPAYNLKAVIKETGLKPDGLRAWERRYNIPAPERTQGGHRLYSEYDIALLKWLIARQKEGLSISRAVELWRKQLANGQEPLADVESSYPIQIKPLKQVIKFPSETNLASIRSQWLAACLNYDENTAEQALNQAFGMFPVEMVCIEVLQRGISEMGTLWYESRASAQQEHFASALAMRRLDSLISSAPASTRRLTVLVGCPPDEWHVFTPLLIALFLRRRGMAVIYLGANVPGNRFQETITSIKPDLVILAAQHLISAASLQQTALLLSIWGAKVAFGGRIFIVQPETRGKIPGHYLGDQLDSAIENVEHLLETSPVTPIISPRSEEYIDTQKLFQTKRPLIESAMNEYNSQIPGSSLEYMEIANRFMGDNILASLQLGDLAYLSGEIDWLTVLLKSHQMPAQMVPLYLETYSKAVSQQLGNQDNLIVDWIDSKIRQIRSVGV